VRPGDWDAACDEVVLLLGAGEGARGSVIRGEPGYAEPAGLSSSVVGLAASERDGRKDADELAALGCEYQASLGGGAGAGPTGPLGPKRPLKVLKRELGFVLDIVSSVERELDHRPATWKGRGGPGESSGCHKWRSHLVTSRMMDPTRTAFQPSRVPEQPDTLGQQNPLSDIYIAISSASRAVTASHAVARLSVRLRHEIDQSAGAHV
jgi:hypothetical protein